MITTAAKIGIGLGCGGAITLAGALTVVLARQGDQLDVVERYGLLSLHAAVVLGIGGGALKAMWEMVKTNRKIGTTLEKLVEARKDDRQSNDEERDAAVKKVVRKIEDGHDAILQTQAALTDGMGQLITDLQERRKAQADRRQRQRRKNN